VIETLSSGERVDAGNPSPVTRISVFLLLEAGATLILKGLMLSNADIVRPWSSTAVMVTELLGEISGMAGMINEVVQPPPVSMVIG